MLHNYAKALLVDTDMRQQVIGKSKKVLHLRHRNIDFGLGNYGALKPVMTRRFLRNDYTHVRVNGVERMVSVSRGVISSHIVWLLPVGI